MRLERASQNIIATGGKENFLKLWDISTCKQTWKCKNVGHDMLNLAAPFWINDIQFSPQNPCQIATGTGHHEFKMYDTNVALRPVVDLKMGKAPIMSVAFAPDGLSVFTGDARGNLSCVDIRMKRINGVYRGISGSIRSLHCHSTLPLVAACGLDRFARVYNIKTREIVHKVYMKQKLNCLIFFDDDAEKMGQVVATNGADESDELQSEVEELSEADDEVWQELEHKRQAKLLATRPSTNKNQHITKDLKRKQPPRQLSDESDQEAETFGEGDALPSDPDESEPAEYNSEEESKSASLTKSKHAKVQASVQRKKHKRR